MRSGFDCVRTYRLRARNSSVFLFFFNFIHDSLISFRSAIKRREMKEFFER